jgi:hypothetical protein
VFFGAAFLLCTWAWFSSPAAGRQEQIAKILVGLFDTGYAFMTAYAVWMLFVYARRSLTISDLTTGISFSSSFGLSSFGSAGGMDDKKDNMTISDWDDPIGMRDAKIRFGIVRLANGDSRALLGGVKRVQCLLTCSIRGYVVHFTNNFRDRFVAGPPITEVGGPALAAQACPTLRRTPRHPDIKSEIDHKRRFGNSVSSP